MSAKVQSLGNAGSAAAGIVISGATNATPIVITLNSGHGLKNGDRLSISGITGNTGANGEWTLGSVGATTATLLGSVGNGTYGGSPVASVLCDTTPFMKGHSAEVVVTAIGVGVATAPVGTVIIEGSDDGTTFVDVKKGVALPAFSTAKSVSIEVDLKKYMRMRCSAYTSGSFEAQIVA
jgi:hypothetical protein